MDFFNSRDIDIDIEDAIIKKKTVDMRMDSIMSLMKEVELKEKAAQKAKQEVDDCTLEIMAEINDLILDQQRAKEANDKRAREVYARKANLATEMNELFYSLSGVLTQGDGCLAAIDEMYESLERRLTSAVKQKKAADDEKLQKEAALAYQRKQMVMLVEESKKLEQQATENIKLQELITDRGRVVSMLEGEISSKFQNVSLLKYKLGGYQDESEIFDTEDCLRSVIPGMLPRQHCECYKIVKSPVSLSKLVRELAMEVLDEGKQAGNGPALQTAYQKSQIEEMEELLEGLKAQEQEKAIGSLKVQEFLRDHVHAVNMSQKHQDANLQKQEVDDSKDETGKPVTKDYSMPIIQETTPMQDRENDKFPSILKGGVKGRVVVGRKAVPTKKNKIIKSRMNNSKMKEMKKWISGQITEAVADYEDIEFA